MRSRKKIAVRFVQSRRHHRRHKKRRVEKLVEARERFRSHADDSEINAIQQHVFAGDIGIGSKFIAPKAIGEYRDRIARWRLVFLGTKRAAHNGPDFQCVEQVPARQQRPLSCAAARSDLWRNRTR